MARASQISGGSVRPDGFRFSVKAPRTISIFGRVDYTPEFCDRMRALGEEPPVLVQPHVKQGRPAKELIEEFEQEARTRTLTAPRRAPGCGSCRSGTSCGTSAVSPAGVGKLPGQRGDDHRAWSLHYSA